MKTRCIKQLLSALLVLCMLSGGMSAFAITAEEALGLTDSGADGAAATYPTLQYGSYDSDDATPYVTLLQNRLISLGYLDSAAADGHYGSGTESAVLSFQENNGLTPTGIADSSMQTVLFSDTAIRAPESIYSDNTVKTVQQQLIYWGFLTGTADGVAGEATKTAVAEFKEYIYSTYASAYAAYATPAPTAEPTLAPNEQPVADDTLLLDESIASESGQSGDITEDVVKFVFGENQFNVYQRMVQTGDDGIEVLRVQRRLNKLGYLYKVDGAFGNLTTNALKYFQRRNNLPESGVADEATQRVLFSDLAIASTEWVFPYKIYVDLSDQRIYIYAWTGEEYSKEVGTAACSTGMRGYDTPTGTFQSGGRVTSGEWYYFSDYNCYAKHAYRIVGGIMFHSVLYDSSKKGPTNSSVRALGRKASHGCIRMTVDNAKWICDNCPEGTTVVIRD